MPDPADATVTVTVPGRAEYLHVLRTVTGAVAARLRLPVDAIDDLRLAVDEAFAALLIAHGSDGIVELTLTPAADALHATIALVGPAGPWPPPGFEETLPWKVIGGLVDHALARSIDGRPTIEIDRHTLDAPLS